jgi:TATA-box binding protein (TBP) (component of TFIID and TFIIIB)
MKEGWKIVLEQEIKNAMNTRKKPFEKFRDAPMLVNTVSTVSILPPGYKLPLHAIAAALGPCCQFEPTQFAAAIIKTTNSTSDATALAFSSGKLVLTATTTHMHTMYMAHVFRLMIEHVQCVMKDEKTGEIVMDKFAGKTVFENLRAHNMVGHGDLGVKVDLRALKNANPDSVKWLPDSFPAAKCCVWLTEDNMCHCTPNLTTPAGLLEEDPDVLRIVPKLLRKRCACTIKCLVFPTNRVVMTGGRNMGDINSVFYRMKALAPHFEVGAAMDILVPRKADSSSSSSSKKKRKESQVVSQEDSVNILLDSIYGFKPRRIKKKQANSSSILLTFAEYGRVSNVKDTVLLLQTEQGDELEGVKEAIAKLTSIQRTTEQTNNLEYLKKYLEDRKRES